ncbi:hypothetical protein AAC387_Pa02g3595 [Persea americana]
MSTNRMDSPEASTGHFEEMKKVWKAGWSKQFYYDRVETFPTYRVGINRHKSDPHVEKSKDSISEQLGLMYDDGYGIAGVIDYLDAAKEMIRPDGGPPYWFFPIECGPPIKGSPIMLFLPGN